VDRLERELHVRRDQTAKGEPQCSKSGLAKGNVDAKAKVDAARVTDSGSGQRMRQLDGRIRQAEERKAGLKVRRPFAQGVTLGGEPTPRRLLLALPEGELSLGQEHRLWFPAMVLRPADRIGIQGPNGAGKSPLDRRIVAGLEAAGATVAYIPQEQDARAGKAILDAFRALPPPRQGRAMALVRRLGSDPARLLQSLETSPGELRKLLLARTVWTIRPGPGRRWEVCG
jgi:ATPase subunit of ABC transporter with duplicated ATPase domains